MINIRLIPGGEYVNTMVLTMFSINNAINKTYVLALVTSTFNFSQNSGANDMGGTSRNIALSQMDRMDITKVKNFLPPACFAFSLREW